MKLAVSNIAWDADRDDEMHAFLQAEGITGIEIAPTRFIPDNPYAHPEQAKEKMEQLKACYGLDICSMQSILYDIQASLFGPPTDRAALRKKTRNALEFASTIGCKNLVYGAPATRIMKSENQHVLAEEFFQDIADYAEKNQTTLSLEPIPAIYKANFINYTHEAFEFVKRINRTGFRVNADMGAMLCNKETLFAIIDNIHLVNHIHISEPYLNPVIPAQHHKQLALELKNSGYNGYVSVEMKRVSDTFQIKCILQEINRIFG